MQGTVEWTWSRRVPTNFPPALPATCERRLAPSISSLHSSILQILRYWIIFLPLQWRPGSKRRSLASVKGETAIVATGAQKAKSHADCSLSPTRIAAGDFYEAHQQLRVITVRYIKQSNFDAAAELLAAGATALFKAGAQQGASASGGDLAIMLVVEVYNKAEWQISGDSNDAEGWARKSE